MDPRLLDYYNQELQHIREGAAEFAREFPKIASRLALETTNAQGECVDPYVERLLEGFAFLTARIQIKIDAEHARFTQALLEMVYPGYLAPVPSAIIARITPDHGEPGLAEGFRLPRGSVLSTRLEPGQRTPCQFRTAHDVILWPLQIKEAKCFGHVPDLPPGVLNDLNNTVRGCLRLRLALCAAGVIAGRTHRPDLLVFQVAAQRFEPGAVGGQLHVVIQQQRVARAARQGD